MKKNFTIEVIMNPLFGNSFLPGNDKRQSEEKWLHAIMLSFLNEQQPVMEAMYLHSTGEMTDYCLS